MQALKEPHVQVGQLSGQPEVCQFLIIELFSRKIDRYSRKIDRYSRKIDRYSRKIDRYSRKIDKYSRKIDILKRGCRNWDLSQEKEEGMWFIVYLNY